MVVIALAQNIGLVRKFPSTFEKEYAGSSKAQRVVSFDWLTLLKETNQQRTAVGITWDRKHIITRVST